MTSIHTDLEFGRRGILGLGRGQCMAEVQSAVELAAASTLPSASV